MKKCQFFVLLSVFWMLTTLALAGEESVQNGVVYVKNSSLPSQGVEKLQLRELWRIGGVDGETIFSSIDKVLLGRDGNLYILDGRSSVVLVRSLVDGSELKTISIAGEGPGELDFACNMFLVKDQQIGLLRSSPAKVVCITYDGQPGDRVDLTNTSAEMFLAWYADWADGLMVMGGQNPGDARIFLSQYAPYGELKSYHSYSSKSSLAEKKVSEEDTYLVLTKPWALDDRGQLYFCPHWSNPDSHTYAIQVYDRRAKLLRVFSRQYEARKRSSAEKKIAQQKLFGGAAGLQALLRQGGQCVVQDYAQDVLEIYVHPDGNIWVHTSRSVYGQAKGSLLCYDVFSPDGHFIKQVSLLGSGNGEKDIVYFLDQEKLVVVKGQSDVLSSGIYTEADVLEVICYSVK